MKKRVLHITQSNGGVSIYLQMLFKYFNRNEFENILVCSKNYIEEEEKFKDIVDVIEYVDMVREINLLKDSTSIISLAKTIKKYNPDIIYVHSSKAGTLGRVANMFSSKPIIYNPHGWAFNMDTSEKKRKLYLLVEKMLAGKTNGIIAISDAEKKSAIDNKVCKEEKVEVIFNGIDIAEYEKQVQSQKYSREEYNIPQDAIVIGMVGRISKQKSPDVFVKAANRIKQQIPNAFFIIVGDGDERLEIESLIKKFNLSDSFLITGWVNDPYKYVQFFDVAMLLSRWEGFGLAIAEYMISRKPIIATNVDAIPNLIRNNEDGLLVDVDDVDAVVKSAISIINDSELKEKIIRNSEIRVKNEFDIKRVVMEHENLFKDILNKTGNKRKNRLEEKIWEKEVTH